MKKEIFFGPINFLFICLLISLKSFGQEVINELDDSSDVIIYERPDVLAEYQGGNSSLLQFIAKNVKLPENVSIDSGHVKCTLRFVVASSGEVKNVEVKKGVPDCPECDREIVRVIRSMPKWKPAKVGGKDVSSYFVLPISFHL